MSMYSSAGSPGASWTTCRSQILSSMVLGPSMALASIHRGTPIGIGRQAVADGGSVDGLELGGHRSRLPVAHLAVVDALHRLDLHAGAGQEDLLGHVDLGTADPALPDLESQLAAGQLDDRLAGDALENVLREGRRGQLPTT